MLLSFTFILVLSNCDSHMDVNNNKTTLKAARYTLPLLWNMSVPHWYHYYLNILFTLKSLNLTYRTFERHNSTDSMAKVCFSFSVIFFSDVTYMWNMWQLFHNCFSFFLFKSLFLKLYRDLDAGADDIILH